MSIKFHEWSEEQLTYPEFYKTGDRDWLGETAIKASIRSSEAGL